MNHAKTATRLLIATTLLAHAGLGSAEPNETAQAAFKRAQSAFKAGRIHQACEAYEASEKLEARVETELGLASCYEQDGKPMAAARLYRGLADTDPNLDRRKTSTGKVAKLEGRAAKLRFAIHPVPAGLAIKVDGVDAPSTGDVLVDLGPHDVVAIAPGFEGHASAPVDRERQIVDVIIRMEPRDEPAPKPTPPPPVTAPAAIPPPAAMTTTTAPTARPALADREPDHRRRNGLVVGAVGVGVLIGAGVLFESSSSKFDDEHALCPGSKCANDADLAKANSLLSDGHTLRGLSIGMGIGSGLLLLAGGYLALTPHDNKEASHVSVHVGHGGAGVAFTGHF